MVLNEQTSFTNSLNRFRRGYDALFALLEDFPEGLRDTPGACGEWSPKQVLAHLGGWLVEANNRYFDFEAGDPTQRGYNNEDDFAAFNDLSVKAREHLSWDETVEELRKSVHALSLHADQIAPEQTRKDGRYEAWLDDLWNNSVEHLGQLCGFIAGKE